MKLANRRASRKRAQTGTVEHVLASGRTLVIAPAGDAELLEVRSLKGEVEVRITLTAAGPVVQVRAARLELESAGTVRFDCRRLEVATREGTDLSSGGEVRIETEKDIHMKGAVIRLNSPVSRSAPSDSPGG